MSNLGTRIKQIRKEFNLTQQEFGEKLLVSASYISKVESGKEIPSNTFIRLITYEFAIDENWLKTGEGTIFLDYDDFNRDEAINNLFETLSKFSKLLITESNVKLTSYEISFTCLTKMLSGYALSEEYLFNFLESLSHLFADIERLMYILNSIATDNKFSIDDVEETHNTLKNHLNGINQDLNDITKIFFSQAIKKRD